MSGQIEKKSVATLVGKVASNKMDKTIVVVIERLVKDKLYGKYVRHRSKIFAHDETNSCHVGDVVVIKQSRPMSKKKSWALVEVKEKAAA